MKSVEVTTPSDRETVVTRHFDARPELLWRAWTEPEWLKRWCWARESPMTECEVDLRVGGNFRWVWRLPDGNDMSVRGTFREIMPARRLVHTERFEPDWTGGETIVTVDFAPSGDGTTVATRVLYATPEARDAALKTEMTDGMAETYGNLDALLPEIIVAG